MSCPGLDHLTWNNPLTFWNTSGGLTQTFNSLTLRDEL